MNSSHSASSPVRVARLGGAHLASIALLLSPIVAASCLCAGIPEPDEVELIGSYFASPLWDGGNHQTFDFAGVSARADWPLKFGSPAAQRWDFVGELLCARVIRGFDPGAVVVGPSAGLRFRLLPTAGTLSPYLLGSFGAIYTDAYRDPNQDQLGEALEFKSTFGVGTSIRLTSEWSGIVEVSLSHISDGGLSRRNCGERRGIRRRP